MPYAVTSQYPSNTGWNTFHKGNPYKRPRLVLLSTSVWMEPPVNHDNVLWMITVEFLDLDDLVLLARSGDSPPLRYRNAVKLDVEPVADNLATSSSGCHVWWVQSQQPPPVRDPLLRLAPFFARNSVPELGWDRSNNSRILQLPFRWDAVLTVLGFCDEAATMFLLTNECGQGCCPPAIRLLEY